MKKLLLLVCITLIFIPACKTTDEIFDIRGTWNVTLFYTNGITISGTWTFSGTETSGTCIDNIWRESGIYTMAGKEISASYTDNVRRESGIYTVTGTSIWIHMDWSGNDPTYIGTGTDNNHMSGTFVEDGGLTGTWTATR